MSGDHVIDLDSLTQRIDRQRQWSEKTFGGGPRTLGVISHIRKELLEIEAKPDDLEEWIDVLILAMDGAWRTGASTSRIIACLEAKQRKNMARTWPMPTSQDTAVEHVRDLDEEPTWTNTHLKSWTDK